jgi:hypothetical protein
MKPSRNDPCPCGSGKKYKKCCLAKDEAAAPSYVPAPRPWAEEPVAAAGATDRDTQLPSAPKPASDPAPPEEPDPLREKRDQWWKEFQAADFEGRVNRFKTALDQPDLLDDDVAFESLNFIRRTANGPEQRERFNAVVDEFRKRSLHLYESARSYYLSWRVEDAVQEGNVGVAADVVREMADSPRTDIDLFHHQLDMLAYQGRLSDLVDVMRRAWPWIKDSKQIVPWAVDGYAQRGGHYEMFAHIVERGDASPDDPELVDRMRPFLPDIDPEKLGDYLDLLQGRDGRQWQLADMHMGPGSKRREPVEAEDALFKLGVTFLGYLYREEKVDFARGDMGREQIVEYLLDRHRGELRRRKSPLDEALHPNKPAPPPFRPPEHPLCPDRPTLDMFIAKMFAPLTRHDYQAVLALEMVPPWLRFLESKGLIDAARRHKTLKELSRLKDDVLRLTKMAKDPAMRRNLERWGEEVQPLAPAEH